MKKLILIMLTLVPVVISTISFSNVYQRKILNNDKHLNNEIINWNIVEYNLNQMQKNISYEKNSIELGIANKDNFNKIIQFIKKKNDDNIAEFKNSNFNINQLIMHISNQHSNFKLIYQNPTKYFSVGNLNFENKINDFFSNTKDVDSLKKHVHNLKISKTTLTTISATAAIAAAGFWAAAWWFGISIPWAVASTIASTLTATASSSISIVLVKYDQELNKFVKVGTVFGSVFSLGHIFYNVLNPVFIGLATAATAVSWAIPTISVVVGISNAILAWISLYK